ncbi:MAG TPA: hypothetical protein P5076_22595, partial [Myxococcota bacterium]|nr:hypothetical protein [Myxococcota bacterium]
GVFLGLVLAIFVLLRMDLRHYGTKVTGLWGRRRPRSSPPPGPPAATPPPAVPAGDLSKLDPSN